MTGSTALRNFLLHPDRLAFVCGCLIAALMGATLTGCKSIRALRVHHGDHVTMSAEEAQTQMSNAWILFEQQPRTLPQVTQAAQQLEKSAHTLSNHFEAHVMAAQAMAYLAEHEHRVLIRKQAAEHGIVLARRARELKPDHVAGHYWYALNVGLLADVDRAYGLDAVDEMVAALNRACELDPAYDHAGPLRLLGLLHLRAPGPPVSIGSKRKAQQLFRRAVDLFPKYPENYIYLAETLRDLGRIEEARANLRIVLALPSPSDCLVEDRLWKTQARNLLKSMK